MKGNNKNNENEEYMRKCIDGFASAYVAMNIDDTTSKGLFGISEKENKKFANKLTADWLKALGAEEQPQRTVRRPRRPPPPPPGQRSGETPTSPAGQTRSSSPTSKFLPPLRSVVQPSRTASPTPPGSGRSSPSLGL